MEINFLPCIKKIYNLGWLYSDPYLEPLMSSPVRLFPSARPFAAPIASSYVPPDSLIRRAPSSPIHANLPRALTPKPNQSSGNTTPARFSPQLYATSAEPIVKEEMQLPPPLISPRHLLPELLIDSTVQVASPVDHVPSLSTQMASSVAKIVKDMNLEDERDQKMADLIEKKLEELRKLGRKDLPSARQSLCRLMCISSIHYTTEKKKVIHQLLYLLARDSGISSHAKGIMQVAKTLMAELNHEKMELETIEFKQLLLWVYANALDVLIIHALKKHVEPTIAFKDRLRKQCDDLDKWNIRDVFFTFQISRVREATRHLLSEDDQWEDLISRIRSVNEAMQTFHKGTPESLEKVIRVCNPRRSEAWFADLLIIRQLLPSARRNRQVLIGLLNAVNTLPSAEYTMGGVELLYHVIQGHNKEAQKLAMEGREQEKEKGALNALLGLSQWSCFNHQSAEKGISEQCYKIRAVALVLLNQVRQTMDARNPCWTLSQAYLKRNSEETGKDRYSREIRYLANVLLSADSS